jgi:hypothetical protein
VTAKDLLVRRLHPSAKRGAIAPGAATGSALAHAIVKSGQVFPTQCEETRTGLRRARSPEG